MATVELRSVIKHLYVKEKNLAETYQELLDCYGDDSPIYHVTRYWYNEFRCGRQTAATIPSLGRPMEIDYSKINPIIEQMLAIDPRLSVKMIALEHNISIGTAFKIIRNDLRLKKLTTKWVPHTLTEENKAKRKQCCDAALALYKKRPTEFLQCILTMDETWVYTYDPETALEAKEWVKSKDDVSQRPVVNIKAEKFMVWWDSFGIAMIKFLEKGQTVDGKNYREQLAAVNNVLRTARPEIPKRKPCFLQDNARPHKAKETMAKIREMNWYIVEHPPYSPDLAPSDYFLFSNLKRHLRGKRFVNLDELKDEVSGYLMDRPQEWYAGGISKLVKRWETCISLEGGYIV